MEDEVTRGWGALGVMEGWREVGNSVLQSRAHFPVLRNHRQLDGGGQVVPWTASSSRFVATIVV